MPLPPRRWFQFKLSTWFVLVAILAWAMLYWPWIETRRELGAPVRYGLFIGTVRTYENRTRPNPDLLYPALALAAFVGLKAALASGRADF